MEYKSLSYWMQIDFRCLLFLALGFGFTSKCEYGLAGWVGVDVLDPGSATLSCGVLLQSPILTLLLLVAMPTAPAIHDTDPRRQARTRNSHTHHSTVPGIFRSIPEWVGMLLFLHSVCRRCDKIKFQTENKIACAVLYISLKSLILSLRLRILDGYRFESRSIRKPNFVPFITELSRSMLASRLPLRTFGARCQEFEFGGATCK